MATLTMAIDTISNNFAIFLLLGSIVVTLLFLLLVILPRCRFPANRFLALFLVAVAITLIHQYLFITGSIKNLTPLIGFNLPLEFIFPPCLYLYIRTLTREPLPNKIIALHFLPTLIGVLLLVPFYTLDFDTRFYIIQNNFDSNKLPGLLHSSFPIFVTATSIQAVVYLYYYFKLLSSHANNITRLYSYRDTISLSWLRNFLIFLILIWISILLSSLFYQESKMLIFDVWLYLFTAAAVIYIGVMGILQIKLPNLISLKMLLETDLENVNFFTLDKKLSTLMKTNKPYLNHKLNLVQLADMLSVTPDLLSAVIEARYHSTFFDFINSLRIDMARNIMIDSAPNYLPLKKIIKQSGFNSLTAFKHEYKKQTGESVSHFEKNMLK